MLVKHMYIIFGNCVIYKYSVKAVMHRASQHCEASSPVLRDTPRALRHTGHAPTLLLST